MRSINRIVIHHSASNVSTTVETIRVWHMVDHKWADIGYHAIIEEDGVLHPGRDLTRVGAHARGANNGSLGICVTGNNLILMSEMLPFTRLSLVVIFMAMMFPLLIHAI